MSDSHKHEASLAKGVESVLAGFRYDPARPYPESVQKAVYLARVLQERACELQTPQERRQQAELDRMVKSPNDKATLMEMTDQAFRAKLPHRAADQLTHILDVQGIPRFFSVLDRTLLRGFQSFGGYLPGVAVPLAKEKMHRETANVVLPAEREMLAAHLNARKAESVRMNVNFLGEAILGEKEAQRKLQVYLEALQMPEVEVVSVKISTVYSQISSLAWKHTIAVLCDRMELLYRAAARSRFTRADGTVVPKFVYMDMEEYRDMELTGRAFMATLDRPGLENSGAGIVLQAYMPDACRTQLRINEWARQRVATRERCQHGNGTRRGFTPRLAASAVQDQAGNRCQFQTNAPGRNEAGEPRCRATGHRLPQSFRPCVRATTRHGERCSRQDPVRDARRYGQPSASSPVRVDEEPVALRAGLSAARLHPCDWLPGTPHG